MGKSAVIEPQMYPYTHLSRERSSLQCTYRQKKGATCSALMGHKCASHPPALSNTNASWQRLVHQWSGCRYHPNTYNPNKMTAVRMGIFQQEKILPKNQTASWLVVCCAAAVVQHSTWNERINHQKCITHNMHSILAIA